MPTLRENREKREEKSSVSDAANARRAETARLRIQTAKIIERLEKHALGKCDMTPTQVAAAQALLKKVLPDMNAVKADIGGAAVVFNITNTPAKQA